MENPLQAAIQHHERGRLHDAAQVYQAILARNPYDTDALHLLGVVAFQFHQYQQAAELISRAIAVRPADAAYYANLAEVWRALGQRDKVQDCCPTALRLQPNYPEAMNNLGLTLQESGDLAAAIEQFQTAAALRPDFASAHNNLANALRTRGDETAAIAHFRRAVQCDPRMAEAHTNLGQLLCERQELTEALTHFRRAVQLRPDFAEARSNLGNVLRDMGQLDEARREYAEALRLDPEIGMISNNMAQLLQEEGRFDDAVSWYQQALGLDSRSPRIHCNLASALGEKDRHEEAAAEYETALRLDPRHAEAHSGLGSVRHEQGRDDDAKVHYETALELKPDLISAACHLGVLHEEHNDLPGAEAQFRAMLRQRPGNATALAHLATMLRSKLPDEDLTALRQRLDDPSVRDGQRAALHFGMAQALAARHQYAEAAEHLRNANALTLAAWQERGETSEPAKHSEYVSRMIATCSTEFFERVRGLGLETERPVFIVGMPRSGTTLVEQVLASHSQVFGAGELRFAREQFESLPAAMSSSDSAMDCLARLDRATIQAVGAHYLDRLLGLNDTVPRIVDKMPDNTLYLGMLAALFAEAKFIHFVRDFRDTAVSCWMTNFRQIRWANDPDHIAARFEDYQRLMKHWRATLPVPLLEVPYEDTVADLEGTARRLLVWCGLDWEPACREFHKTERPVRTASVTQVREPVYTRSVARWKHHEPALGCLFAQLVPAISPTINPDRLRLSNVPEHTARRHDSARWPTNACPCVWPAESSTTCRADRAPMSL
jgi:tetratricopeptide (TPR) repeat protein